MTLFGDDDKRTNCVRDFFNGFFKGNCGSEISSLNFRWRDAREERSMVESFDKDNWISISGLSGIEGG